jgi:hypothetical protein
MQITRASTGESYTVDAEADAVILAASVWAGGCVEVEGALTVNVYGCNFENPVGRTFKQAYDLDGVAKTLVAADARVQDLPNIHGMRWIKLVGTTTVVQLHRAG